MTQIPATREETLAKVMELLKADAVRWEKVMEHIRKIQNNQGGASIYDFGEDTFGQMRKHALGLREMGDLIESTFVSPVASPSTTLTPEKGRVSFIEME